MSLSTHNGQNTFSLNSREFTNRAADGGTPIYDITGGGGSGGGGQTKALIRLDLLMQGTTWNHYAYGTVDVTDRINSMGAHTVGGDVSSSIDYEWQLPGDGSYVYDPTDVWIMHSRKMTDYGTSSGNDEKKMHYLKDVADMSPRGGDNGQISGGSFQSDHYWSWIASEVFTRRRGHKLDVGTVNDNNSATIGYEDMSESSYLEIRG